MAVYDTGDTVRIGNASGITGSQAFKNLAGADTDPTVVTLRVEQPDGTITTYTYGGSPALQKEVTGRYYVDIILSQAGRLSWRLTGTGTVAAAAEGSLHVKRSLIG